MEEEFVVGFFKHDREGLTEIDNVSEITGMSFDEIRQVYETVIITIPDNLPEE